MEIRLTSIPTVQSDSHSYVSGVMRLSQCVTTQGHPYPGGQAETWELYARGQRLQCLQSGMLCWWIMFMPILCMRDDDAHLTKVIN